MIDVTRPNTRLITLQEAAAILGITRATMHRYITQGYDGRRLEIVFVGGHRKTTREAIQRFLSPPASHAVSRVVSEEVAASLKRHGIE